MERFLFLRNWFDKTVSEYLTGDSVYDDKINLKKEHSLKVVENIEILAKSIELKEFETELAMCIALLHDAGRFEQIKKYNTFSDKKSEDHAALGLKIIEEADILNDFSEEEKAYIKFAIQNHNKFAVASAPDKKAEEYAKLIRDADKLDIYRVVTEYYSKYNHSKNSSIEMELPDRPVISKKIYESVMKEKTADYNDLETLTDFKILQMAWVFDINYKCSFKIINEKSYIKNIYDTMSKNDEVIDVYRKVKIFLENNL